MSSPSVFEFIPRGAIIHTFLVDKTNIVQGFPKPELYGTNNDPHFGRTIGRVANRIKGAKLDSLNGKSYSLVANENTNSLHGGSKGWGTLLWDGPKPVGVRTIPGLSGVPLNGGESVSFTLTSKDGDEGFPGTVEASVIYTVGTQTTADGKEAVVLGIEYEAKLVGDADETVINMTNHS